MKVFVTFESIQNLAAYLRKAEVAVYIVTPDFLPTAIEDLGGCGIFPHPGENYLFSFLDAESRIVETLLVDYGTFSCESRKYLVYGPPKEAGSVALHEISALISRLGGTSSEWLKEKEGEGDSLPLSLPLGIPGDGHGYYH